MAAEWANVTIEEIKAAKPNAIAMGPFGSNIKTDNFVPSGVPIIRGNNLNAERLLDENFVYLTEEKASELRASNAFPGDIVITHRGTLGQVGIIPYNAKYPRYVVSQSQMKLTVDPQKADPFYVFYFLRSPQGQYALLANTSQTGVPAIAQPTTSLKAIIIPLPSLDEQRAISYIISTLDEKIELNRKINQSLEAMARAIFKSWFEDFDPVRAKAEGRDLGLPPDLVQIFPDSFEDSELGEIPKGWTARPFSEFVQIIGGGTPKTTVAEYWGGNIPWFSVADAPDDGDVYVINTDKKITQAGLDNSATQLLPEGTTIISARGTVGKVALVGVPMAMNQSCYGLLGIESGPSCTYFATRTLVSILKQHGHGSVFNTITRDTLAGINFVSPPKRIFDAFEPAVAPMMQRIKSNLIESRTLTALRDALLPKLLSGEVRVKDVEKITTRKQL